jgi:hypothetical protein
MRKDREEAEFFYQWSYSIFSDYNGFGCDLLKECKSCAFAFFSRCHTLRGNYGIKIILWLHELNDV